MYSRGDRVFVYVRQETHDSLRKATVIDHQNRQEYPVFVALDEPIDGDREFRAREGNVFPMLKDDA